jgi:hypothetical protein
MHQIVASADLSHHITIHYCYCCDTVQVFQDIQAAMQAKDMGALGAALREAEILDMDAELLEYRYIHTTVHTLFTNIAPSLHHHVL